MRLVLAAQSSHAFPAPGKGLSFTRDPCTEGRDIQASLPHGQCRRGEGSCSGSSRSCYVTNKQVFRGVRGHFCLAYQSSEGKERPEA